jgi:methyl-accepting chemotaxis protein
MLELAFGFASVVGMAGTTAASYVRASFGTPALASAGFIVLGVCAGIGLWAREALERAQRGELARVYAAALSGRRDARLERGGDPTRLESLHYAIADLIQTARRSMFGRDSLASSVVEGRRAIETSRQRGQTVVASMSEDAHAIANAAQGSREVERGFVACMQTVRGKAAMAEQATACLIGEVDSLADSIRAVTVQTERSTTLAARLAETAFAAQQGIATMSETTASLQSAAARVHDSLQRAELVGLNAGIEASRASDGPPGFAVVASDIKELAQTGAAALAQMLGTVRELRQQTAEMFERMQQISDVVQAQNEFGHALSHASMLQADAVGRMARQVGAAHGEVHGLGTQVRDMPLPDVRLGVTPAAQQAVERLPGYADAMAQILRGLPDFSPVEKSAAEKASEQT